MLMLSGVASNIDATLLVSCCQFTKGVLEEVTESRSTGYEGTYGHRSSGFTRSHSEQALIDCET